MLRAYLGVFLLIAFSITNGVNAAMTSTNYNIYFDAISSGGTDFSTSTNYWLHDTIGEQATGYATSTSYLLHAGYRQVDELTDNTPTLEFILGAQEDITKTAYTAINISGKTVTVTDATYYTTDTRIGVVEDQGLLEKVVVGKVTEVNGLVLTVDKWDGTTSTMSAIPSGGNDFVYRTEGHLLDFGNLQQTGQAGIVQTEVSTNATNGYTLQIIADGNLRTTAGHHIHDVADDLVTAGQNEYGAHVYGDTATSTGFDFPLITAYRDIQESTTTASAERIGMIYKLSIDSATIAGHYEQTVAYLLTANF